MQANDTLGGPDATGDDLLAWTRHGGSPRIDVGPDGLLWLFNPSFGGLQIHDRNGARIAQHGRIGQGPGEFQWLESLVALDGGAWTWDSDNQQLARWSVSEGFVTSHHTQSPREGIGHSNLAPSFSVPLSSHISPAVWWIRPALFLFCIISDQS